MQNRLKKALLESIHFQEASAGEMPAHPLNSFRFNEALSLEQCLGNKLQVSQQAGGGYQVEIPSINPVSLIQAPPGTNRIQIQVKVLSFSFDHDRTSDNKTVTINIPYQNTIQPVIRTEMNLISSETGIFIFAAALTYWQDDIRIKFSVREPAEIVAVFG